MLSLYSPLGDLAELHVWLFVEAVCLSTEVVVRVKVSTSTLSPHAFIVLLGPSGLGHHRLPPW